jgi:sulfate adenylyltransferase subunit 2
MVSKARSVEEIILELESNNISERAGRLIDGEKNDSMEFKKREGYF